MNIAQKDTFLHAVSVLRLHMPKRPNLYTHILSLFIVLLAVQWPAAAQEEATYNRFQYHKYSWRAFHSKQYHVYYPANAADSLLRFIVREMPDVSARLKKATIRELPKNLNIIVYPSVDQVYETNIGGYEAKPFTFPTFAYKGTRIVLAYNGSYGNLRDQLYEGLSRALWESQISEERVGAAVTAKKGKKDQEDIPMWFKEGAIRYFAHGWTMDAEDQFRHSFEERRFAGWQEVLAYEPRLAGHAFCYFLARKYYPLACEK